MARTKLREDMLTALKLIQSKEPKSNKFGLCQNLCDLMPHSSAVLGELTELFKTWPMYSGDEAFPVPSPDVEPDVAYCNFTGNMWDKRTAYGSNRWNLLDHCINSLSQED